MAFVLFASGCSGLLSGGVDDGGGDVVRASFKVRGMMVVKPAGKSARRLSFVWRRGVDDIGDDGAVDIITVRNVAGIVQAQIRIDDDGARLATAAKSKQAKDAKTLMTRVFGLPLPLRLLGDFLGGGDNMQLQMQVRESLGDEMRALGWRARFGERDDEGLPLRFGADGRRGSVDIVITRRQ